MVKIAEHIKLVKFQIGFHESLLVKSGPNAKILRSKHEKLIGGWKSLLKDLEELESRPDPSSNPEPLAQPLVLATPSSAPRLGRLGDLSDLPKELLAELGINEGDVLENQILQVIKDGGGEGSVNEILIGLYRQFGVIQKRRFLATKLYRMVRNRKSLYVVPRRRGVYSVSPPTVVPKQPLLKAKKAEEKAAS